MTTQQNTTITTTLTLVELNELIAKVAAAEKITKAGLSVLSRELLAFVYQHGDVTPINTLLGSDSNGKFLLTPMNWRVAVQYFNHFVAFTSNFEKEVKEWAVNGSNAKAGSKRNSLVFNKKSKKQFITKEPLVIAWLAVETNDIWEWSEDVKVDLGDIDYMKPFLISATKLMDEEKGNVSVLAMIAALIDGTDTQLTDLQQFLENPLTAEEALAVGEAD